MNLPVQHFVNVGARQELNLRDQALSRGLSDRVVHTVKEF